MNLTSVTAQAANRSRFYSFYWLILSLVLFFGLTMAALSQPLVVGQKSSGTTEIDITQGRLRSFVIAIPNFVNDEGSTFGVEIASLISTDLRNSGRFRPLDTASHGALPVTIDTSPDFSAWLAAGAQGLLTGKVSVSSDDLIIVEFRLWDTVNKRQLAGRKFTAKAQSWRRLAHNVADVIYRKITGESGYFDSLIVFVDERGAKNARRKQIAIMDQDGFNVRTLISSNRLTITPRFDRTAKRIAYMDYSTSTPQVYMLELATGRISRIGTFAGMTFAPRFSPNGTKMVMSLQVKGSVKLFEYDLKSSTTRQITTGYGLDTSADYSPDGTRLVFESDRDGTNQLYKINIDGTQLQKVSLGEGAYATPVWSPRDNLIAFTKRYNGRFQIGVMKPDGSGEKVLTESYHNEGPSWAPNGQMLVFFREDPGVNGGPRLWTIGVNGENERLLPTPSFASDPSWSPLLD